jgi:hypothetical protein
MVTVARGAQHQSDRPGGAGQGGVSVKGVSVKGVSVKGVSVKGVSVKGVSVKGVSVKGVSVKDVLYWLPGGVLSLPDCQEVTQIIMHLHF